MKTRFYIEKRTDTDSDRDGRLLTHGRPIFMTVAFHGKRVVISSGKKIDMHWWDEDKQSVRKEYPEADVLNTWFENMKQTALLAWTAIGNLEQQDPDAFRAAYQRLKPQFSNGFFDLFYHFMEEGSQRWNKATYSKVRTIYKHLKEFENVNGSKLTFSKMNNIFLVNFKRFYNEKGNSDLTTKKAVNVLVWFLNWATEKKYNIYTNYRDFYKELNTTSDLEKKTAEIYLEWEELMKIYTLTLDEPKKQRARDIFCFICFTGLRFSEIQELKKEHILNDKILVSKHFAKTRIVPLNKYSREIVSKYENKYYRNNTALPVMSLVSLNKYIKIIAHEAGLNNKVQHYNRTLKKSELLPKSSIITAGTASLTFIMNALKLDIPAEIISSYTGVSNDRRIKILKQQMANKEMDKFNNI